jgi:hypothetical protein
MDIERMERNDLPIRGMGIAGNAAMESTDDGNGGGT